MSLSPSERVLLERRLTRRRRSSGGARVAGLLLAVLAAVPLVLVGIGAGAVGVAYASLADELEQGIERIRAVEERELFESTRIYDRNGVLLRELFFEGRRTYVPLSDIPLTARQATIAVEDNEFYTNPGIDIGGIARAVRGELTGVNLGGGSTITQQFVRHVAFSYEERVTRSYARKAKEIVLAVILTQEHSKDQILEWYLNEIYYGNLAYGIEAASQTVFGKPAEALDLAESALLAGLPQLPATYDPLDPAPEVQARVAARQREVLDLMVNNGFITPAEADAAAARELTYNDPDEELFLAPHFVVHVQDTLEEMLGAERLARGGLEVTTTLDYELQALGERVVRDHVESLRERHDLTNASLVALEPRTGQVLAMVGSADYWDDSIDGRVNVALRPRQPGSSIKPIAYLTALEQKMPASSMLWDVKMELMTPSGLYEPTNYDEVFHGPVRLRTALANSYNIPALKLLAAIRPSAEHLADHPDDAGKQGVELMIDTAHRMGITGLNKDPWHYGLSLTLGGGEVTLLDLTTAYATMANQGQLVRPNEILSIVDSAGRDVYRLADDARALEPQPAVDPAATHIITDILSDDEARLPAFGASNPLDIGVPAAAKTGTTNEYRDNWTLGFTPYLTVGAWAGNSDNSRMRNSSGVTGAAPIWSTFTRNVAANADNRQRVRAAREAFGFPFETSFVRPDGVVEREVCRLDSLRSLGATCREYRPELFIEDHLPDGATDAGPIGAPRTAERASENRLGAANDVWTSVPAVAVPMPPPPPEAIAAAEAEDRELRWPPARLCFPAGVGGDKAQPVAVLPLPTDEDERRFVIEWATTNGWAALEPSEPCTAQMADAAFPPGELPGGGAVGTGAEYSGIAADYRLAIAPGTVLTARTELTGTVTYDPAQIEYFKVELGRGQQPTEWFTLGDIHQGPVVDGRLETLDAASLAPGEYIVRLVLVKKDGNFLQPPDSVPIRIAR